MVCDVASNQHLPAPALQPVHHMPCRVAVGGLSCQTGPNLVAVFKERQSVHKKID